MWCAWLCDRAHDTHRKTVARTVAAVERISISFPSDLRRDIQIAKGDASEGDFVRRACAEKIQRDRCRALEQRVAKIEFIVGITPSDTTHHTAS